MALKSSASEYWYCPTAAWISSQSTYWTLPATADCAKAGAAAASTIASIAANNITFLNLIPSLPENALSGKHSFTKLLQRQHHPAHFFAFLNITQNHLAISQHRLRGAHHNLVPEEIGDKKRPEPLQS